MKMIKNIVCFFVFPAKKFIFFALVKHKILTNCESPIIGGDNASPPQNRRCRVRWYCIPFSGIIAQRDPTAAGAEAYHAAAPKSVEKNSVRISTKLIFCNLMIRT